jgi:fatty-acyl-CoA synthase
MIGRMQGILREQGLLSGQRIALLTANRAETWCVGVAAQGLGLATTWLHPMGALEAHGFQLEDADVSAVVIDAAHYQARGAEIALLMPNLKIFTLGDASYGLDILNLSKSFPEAMPVDYSKVDGIATLNYTGGTTGRQKGVVKSNATISQVVISMLADFEFPAEPRFLAVAPISHVTGTNVVPTLLRGGTIHLMAKFDIEQMAQIIKCERINFLMMVPTMIYSLLDHPRIGEFDLSSLELLLYAGSPMSRSRLEEGADRLGPIFSQSYGQSECFPITLLRKAHHDLSRPERLESCGLPVTSCEVRLVED